MSVTASSITWSLSPSPVVSVSSTRGSRATHLCAKTEAFARLLRILALTERMDCALISKLDRLARSVDHLSQISSRFQQENIDLVVLDQNIDTRTSTGRLMFNMGVCAQFSEKFHDVKII
ncbi:recombinase family protein [Xenorhabdus thailandensis]|uniref:recombinase family protein n=1 Tax=Xenorhabdus thailandensis TaxID=3136255 RepID=UPI003BF55267